MTQTTNGTIWIVAVAAPRTGGQALRGRWCKWDAPMTLRAIVAETPAEAETAARGKGWRERVTESVEINASRVRDTRESLAYLRALGATLTPASVHTMWRYGHDVG